MTYVQLLLSIVAIPHWFLHQLDIKVHFYNVILKRKCIQSNHLSLLLRQNHLLCFVGCTSHFMVLNSLLELDMIHSKTSKRCIYLILYVDDIVIIDSNQQGIFQLKYLSNQFQTKDLGKSVIFWSLR
jgi:hypothetical protein